MDMYKPQIGNYSSLFADLATASAAAAIGVATTVREEDGFDDRRKNSLAEDVTVFGAKNQLKVIYHLQRLQQLLRRLEQLRRRMFFINSTKKKFSDS